MTFRPIVVLVFAAGLLNPLTAVSVRAAERSVRDIQKALADGGLKPGVPDGVWGKRSIAALRAYQAANGLPPTGAADQATIDRLFPTPPAVEDEKPAVAGSASENVTPLPKVPEVETKPLGPIGDSASSTDASPAQVKAVEAPTPSQQTESARRAESIPPTTESSGGAVAPRSVVPSDSKIASWNLALVGLAVGGVALLWRRRKQRRQAASANGMPAVPDSEAVAELTWDKEAFRVLTEQSATVQTTSPSQDRATSMEAHNRNVTDWIKANASKAKSLSDGGNDDLTDITERGQKTGVTQPNTLPDGHPAEFPSCKGSRTKAGIPSTKDGRLCRQNGRSRMDIAGEIRHRRFHLNPRRHVLPWRLPR